MRPAPPEVLDRDSWRDVTDLDEHGVDLSQWEIEFVESLTQQLLSGETLSEKQKQKLASIIEERVP